MNGAEKLFCALGFRRDGQRGAVEFLNVLVLHLSLETLFKEGVETWNKQQRQYG